MLKKIETRVLDTNNYLIIDESSRLACLIDCSQLSREIEETLMQYGATLKYILLTHGHCNHVAGVIQTAEKYKCQVLMHEADAKIISNHKKSMIEYGLKPTNPPKIHGKLKDGQVLSLGSTQINVLHTPGHTQGSVCFATVNDLYSGDTLLFETIGATDSKDSSERTLKESIRNKILLHKDSMTVHPGHGQSTTIGHEKFYNLAIS